MNFVLSLLLMTIAPLTYAVPMPDATDPGGDDAGNGGDVVSCEGGTIELLDLYEGRTIYGFKIAISEEKEAIEVKVKKIFDRLKRLDVGLHAKFSEMADAFFANAVYLEGSTFDDIDDSSHIPLPACCHIEQIAIQKEPEFPREPTYYLNRELWDKLPVSNAAALVIHEIVFRYALGHGHRNSRFARYFTAYLASSDFEQLSPKVYQGLLRKMHLDKVVFEDTTSTPRVTWTLSNDNFSSAKKAAEFCTAARAGLVSDDRLFDNMTFLRNSLLGKYHIPAFGELKVWTRQEFEPVLMRLSHIDPPSVVEGPAPAGRALCAHQSSNIH